VRCLTNYIPCHDPQSFLLDCHNVRFEHSGTQIYATMIKTANHKSDAVRHFVRKFLLCIFLRYSGCISGTMVHTRIHWLLISWHPAALRSLQCPDHRNKQTIITEDFLFPFSPLATYRTTAWEVLFMFGPATPSPASRPRSGRRSRRPAVLRP